jgi:hypothetical protein
MILHRYCIECGRALAPRKWTPEQTGLCRECFVEFANKRRASGEAGQPYEHQSVITGIREQRRHYGEHPQCKGCAERCKQYCAPHSIVLFCPRIARELEAGRPVIIRGVGGGEATNCLR